MSASRWGLVLSALLLAGAGVWFKWFKPSMPELAPPAEAMVEAPALPSPQPPADYPVPPPAADAPVLPAIADSDEGFGILTCASVAPIITVLFADFARRTWAAHKVAAAFFVERLASPEAEIGRRFLAERGGELKAEFYLPAAVSAMASANWVTAWPACWTARWT